MLRHTNLSFCRLARVPPRIIDPNFGRDAHKLTCSFLVVQISPCWSSDCSSSQPLRMHLMSYVLEPCWLPRKASSSLRMSSTCSMTCVGLTAITLHFPALGQRLERIATILHRLRTSESSNSMGLAQEQQITLFCLFHARVSQMRRLLTDLISDFSFLLDLMVSNSQCSLVLSEVSLILVDLFSINCLVQHKHQICLPWIDVCSPIFPLFNKIA